MAAKSMLDIAQNPNQFDLRTHFWDNQGRLVKKSLYTAYVVEGRTYYERPVNSGNLWTDNNMPAGRISRRSEPHPQLGPWEVDSAAKHVEFTVAAEGDVALQVEIQKGTNRIAELEAELAAIRTERETQSAPKVTAEASQAPSLSAKKG